MHVCSCDVLHNNITVSSCYPLYVVDDRVLMLQKEMDQLKVQYNQLRHHHHHHLRFKALKTELDATKEENLKLKEQLQKSKFGFDSIKDSDFKVNFFTGIQTVQVFICLLNIVQRSLCLSEGLSYRSA